MAESIIPKKVLVMGIGNTQQQDDGIGIHITETFNAQEHDPNIDVIDGGTIGLALLPEIEDHDAVIIVDASEIGERPGTMRIFRNQEIDRQTGYRTRSIISLPIKDRQGEVFGVAQLLNRKDGQPFDTNDEERFDLFMSSLGVMLETLEGLDPGSLNDDRDTS